MFRFPKESNLFKQVSNSKRASKKVSKEKNNLLYRIFFPVSKITSSWRVKSTTEFSQHL